MGGVCCVKGRTGLNPVIWSHSQPDILSSDTSPSDPAQVCRCWALLRISSWKCSQSICIKHSHSKQQHDEPVSQPNVRRTQENLIPCMSCWFWEDYGDYQLSVLQWYHTQSLNKPFFPILHLSGVVRIAHIRMNCRDFSALVRSWAESYLTWLYCPALTYYFQKCVVGRESESGYMLFLNINVLYK